MPAPTISATIREVIMGDVDVPADDIIRRVKAKGVTASESSIRDAIYNVKSELRKATKKKAAKAAKPAPAAARETKEPAAVTTEAPAVVAVLPAAPAPDMRAVFANVTLVNGVLEACGGVEGARKVAEAVQACGGVESFLLHLDLIAQVRGASA